MPYQNSQGEYDRLGADLNILDAIGKLQEKFIADAERLGATLYYAEKSVIAGYVEAIKDAWADHLLPEFETVEDRRVAQQAAE